MSYRTRVQEFLAKRKRPVRTLSGVTVVAIMSHPYPCPHGKCLYCPGGPECNTPQSYIGEEPALMRAIYNRFDPYYQVRNRLQQYVEIGHKPSKVELIVMGGTFPAMPLDYQEWFVTMALEAMNRFPKKKPRKYISLEEAQVRNEHAKIRCIGITFETRPDWAKEKHVDFMLKLGGTRVELGVQTIYDDVLKTVKRGHGVRETIEATRILKDAGFKVAYHIMPGLPGSNLDRDLEMVKTIFEDPRFKPDMLKIYPTLVIEGTGLYNLWKQGKYSALTDEEAVELISEMYRYIPKWVRIMRIQRDVPSQLIIAGPKKGNLRQLVERRVIEKKIPCREIRFREVGLKMWKEGIEPDIKDIKLLKEEYEASEGFEIFLSIEDTVKDILIAFLRLRIPSEKAHRPEVDSKTAIVRELHVYGPQVPIGEEPLFEWQHKNWGRILLREAEKIAVEKYDAKKIIIISGIGVREYYRRLGYFRPSLSPYMVKYCI